MLKADFHMHTWFSNDCGTSPKKLVDRCIQVGLNCIAVTDHNSIRGALQVQQMAPFMVIIGEEIRTSEGEITGLFLKTSIPPDLPIVDTARKIKEQGGLVSIPHPFDHFRRTVVTRPGLNEVLPYADIVEVFNSRNTFSSDNQKALVIAQEKGLLCSAVSDAHTIYELGRTYMELPDFDGTPEGFKSSLAQATLITRKVNPLVHLVTSFVKIKTRLGKHKRELPS